MLPAARMDEVLDNAFDDHHSVTTSLEDFEEQEHRSPRFEFPLQQSGFRSELEESDMDDRSSMGAPWSPPGFRGHPSRTGRHAWFRQDPYSRNITLPPSHSPSRSRQTSPEYQDAMEGEEDEEITLPANIPLPAGRTDSPTHERSPEPEAAQPERVRRDWSQEPAHHPDNCSNLPPGLKAQCG